MNKDQECEDIASDDIAVPGETSGVVAMEESPGIASESADKAIATAWDLAPESPVSTKVFRWKPELEWHGKKAPNYHFLSIFDSKLTVVRATDKYGNLVCYSTHIGYWTTHWGRTSWPDNPAIIQYIEYMDARDGTLRLWTMPPKDSHCNMNRALVKFEDSLAVRLYDDIVNVRYGWANNPIFHKC